MSPLTQRSHLSASFEFYNFVTEIGSERASDLSKCTQPAGQGLASIPGRGPVSGLDSFGFCKQASVSPKGSPGKKDGGAALLHARRGMPLKCSGCRTRRGCISRPRGEARLLRGLHFGGVCEHPSPAPAPPRGEGKPLRHHVTRPPGASARPGEAPPLQPPRARSAQMSRVGLEKGKAGEGSAARGPAPYVAACLPPASSPGPVSPRRGSTSSSPHPSQWRGGASLSGRRRGVRAGPGAPAPCRPPLAVRRRWRRRWLGESEQRAGPRGVSEGAEPPACPPPPSPLRKQEPGPGPGTPPQPLPRRQAARASRASQGEGERASEPAPGGGGRTERAPARVA